MPEHIVDATGTSEPANPWKIDSDNAGLVSIVGSGGTPVDVIPTNGFNGLVAIAPGHVSTDNSTTQTLIADESFTGEWEEITNFGVIVVSVTSNVASATDGLMVEFSTDATVGGLISDDDFTIAAGAKKTFSFQAAAKFYRVVYTNGIVIQTSFNLQTVLKPYYVKPSSHRIQDSIVDDDDAELVKSVLTGQSDINQTFENVKTYRSALQVDAALVHKIGISEHAKLNADGSTTLDVAATAGDTLINVASTTNFAVGSLITINGTSLERSHFHIVAVNAGVSLTLNRPLDNDHLVGVTIQEITIAMNVNGSLASPISFKIQPPSTERWQLTRVLITMLDDSSMDDGQFGGIPALTNGVVMRLHINGLDQTLTHWQSNADMKDDMFDVEYANKAPAGQFGLSGRWTFTKAEFVADLDGANGDYLELLIQDDLTALLDYEIKSQGRLFGG